jgi:hypothetical protein
MSGLSARLPRWRALLIPLPRGRDYLAPVLPGRPPPRSRRHQQAVRHDGRGHGDVNYMKGEDLLARRRSRGDRRAYAVTLARLAYRAALDAAASWCFAAFPSRRCSPCAGPSCGSTDDFGNGEALIAFGIGGDWVLRRVVGRERARSSSFCSLVFQMGGWRGGTAKIVNSQQFCGVVSLIFTGNVCSSWGCPGGLCAMLGAFLGSGDH